MVWGTAFILFLVFFPDIINKIKRIKIKDIEIELQDTLARSTTEDYISV